MAVTFEQAKTEQFRQYGTQILKNAQALAIRLMSHGYKIATGTVTLEMSLPLRLVSFFQL